MVQNKRWIQQANLKRGTLSRQLGIPEEKNIPKTLLREIIKARPGDVIDNPTKKGRPYLRVTRLMERRSILALNLKAIAESKKKKKR